jgi:Asp-tRNA(Asn)/Glu-tRNA(Gln) amidotransferase B subunit
MSDKTVEEIMGLVERFRNGEVSDRLIRQAITALAAERDQAVTLANSHQMASEELREFLDDAMLERDALQARVVELEEEAQDLWERMREE